MNPHRKVMIENKHIRVGDNSYKLTILKYIDDYTAYLSDVNSQFTIKKRFTLKQLMANELERWIVSSDTMNDPESSYFGQLERWSGVVRV